MARQFAERKIGFDGFAASAWTRRSAMNDEGRVGAPTAGFSMSAALRVTLAAAAALLAASIGSDLAGAQDAGYCQQLRAQIAAAGQSGGGRNTAAYDAAAQKQRSEIDRTIAYSRQLGCDRQRFFIFGSDPPPQCGEVSAQIARMQANLGQLQARGSGGGPRGELVARYNAECANPQPHSHGLFDALFGGQRDDQPRVADVPLVQDPNAPDADNPDKNANPEGGGVQAHSGSKEVCVRTCDGYFFPIGYSGSGGRSGDLQEMCRALCPNAQVALYSYPPSGDINEAVGADGTHYADLPNALKYRKSVDQSCSCKRRGQSWAQALADAESLLGERKNDILVTPEKSEELSRLKPDPKADAKAKQSAKADAAKGATATPTPTTTDPKNAAAAAAAAATAPPPPGQEVSPADALLSQQTATMSRETSGIAAGDATTGPSYSKGQGQTEEVTGADGVKKRVRIIDPTL
jgi:hypothetical protein